MNDKLSSHPNLWISILLIALGCLFLLQNLDFIYLGDFWDFWPVLLIGIGLAKLVNSNFKDVYASGILIVIGTIFLLLNLGLLFWSDIWQFWPLILVLIGLRLLWNYRRQNDPLRDQPQVSKDRIDVVAIFGGKELRLTSNSFQGGNVTTLFGGTEIHLENSRLAFGQNVLDIFAMFGGVEIYVPENWKVVTKGFPLFGGFENKARSLPSEEYTAEDVLIIKGFVAFGGIEILNSK